MKTAYNILNLNKEEYKEFIFEVYLSWAEEYSNSSDRLLQEILINKPISKWFVYEYAKLVEEFRELIKPYESLKIQDKVKAYINTVTRIYEIYPKALLDDIGYKKITPERCFNLN